MTQELLQAEDEYRRIGSRYYYWGNRTANGTSLSLDEASRAELEDALHGNISGRAYFKHWRELESSIHSAIQLLRGGHSFEAYQKCFSAFPQALAITEALSRLNNHINVVGSYREDFDHYRDRVGHDDVAAARDNAM